MIKKRTYITIGIITAIYTVLMIFFYYVYIYINVTVIFDPDNILKYDGSSWRVSDKLDSLYENYNVYSNYELLGNYSIRHSLSSKRWSVYDKSNKKITTENIFAYKGNKKMSLIPFYEEELPYEYENVLKSYLDSKGIAISLEQCYSNFYEIDLNNDGVKEQIITVSNKAESSSLLAFDAVIINNGGKTTEVKFKSDKSDKWYNVGYTYLYKIIDIKEDGKYELFFWTTYFGNSHNCISVVESKGKKIDIDKKC